MVKEASIWCEHHYVDIDDGQCVGKKRQEREVLGINFNQCKGTDND